MTQLDVIKDFYETFSNDLDNLISYLPMITPDDNEDRKILLVALDMMKTLKSDLKNASSVAELTDTINVDSLMQEWADLKMTLDFDGKDPRRDSLDKYIRGFYEA